METSALNYDERAADLVSAGIIICDKNADIIYANSVASVMLGLDVAVLLGMSMAHLQVFLTDENGRGLPLSENPVIRVLDTGLPASMPRMGLYGVLQGVISWVRVTANPIFPERAAGQISLGQDAPRQIDYVVVTLINISHEILAAAKLRESEERLNQIMALLPVGVCITDDQGCFEFTNHSYQNFYGYSEMELIGQHFSILLSSEKSKRQLTRLHDDFIKGADGKDLRREWLVTDRQRRQRVILTDGARVLGADGKYRRVSSIVDISLRKELELRLLQAQHRLEKLAITDGLTDLYNRRHADYLLRNEAKRIERYGGDLVVAMLDIDHFKRVNDQFGHTCGDQVLVAVANEIRGSLRDVDHACRYGGEEFLLILPAISLQRCMLALRHLTGQVRKLSIPPVNQVITLSAGVTAFIPGESPEKLLKRADVALYQAKTAGRDRVISC